MTETEVMQKRKKQEPETDWWDVATHIGVLALQGIIAGAAGAFGSRIVNGMMEPSVQLNNSENGSVISLKRTGAA